MSKSDQLLMLINHFAGGNKAEFARRLSTSPQNLNAWIKNGYIDIEKVYYACEGVSADWLLSGEGEMLKIKKQVENAPSDVQIPILRKKDLLSGNWGRKDNHIVVQGEFISCDFLARIPNGDLGHWIYPGSFLFCCYKKVEELEKERLYVVYTASGNTIFAEYRGSEGVGEAESLKFMTRRGYGQADMKFELPRGDIERIAEIEEYTVSHYVENVI